MAPELVRRTGHTYSVDIWSVGCVIIEMLTGSPPWSNVSRNVKAILDLISRTTEPPEFPAGISLECRSFLKACL